MAEILRDEQFLSDLVSRLTDKVELLVNRKLEELESKFRGLDEGSKQLTQKIELLERENHQMRDSLDAMEQYSRRNTVRFLGVPCDDGSKMNEDMENSLLELVNNNSRVKLDHGHVDRCHPIGTLKDGKRDFLIQFCNFRHRQELLANRRVLRESGVNVVEDLTRNRYQILKSARAMFGGKNVWTLDGVVNCRVQSKKYVLKTLNHLQALKDAA